MSARILEHVDTIHDHTDHIRRAVALLFSVLQAEAVIGTATLGDGLADLLIGIDTDTRAIEAALELNKKLTPKLTP